MIWVYVVAAWMIAGLIVAAVAQPVSWREYALFLFFAPIFILPVVVQAGLVAVLGGKRPS